MSSNKELIRLTTKISIASLFFTYLVSLNKELSILLLNCKYISNDFFFAIFGGIFASTIVVLLCEIQKYLQNKRNIEDYFFYNLAFFYGKLFSIKNNIHYLFSNAQEHLSKNQFDNDINVLQNIINSLLTVDYSTFKNGEITKLINNYKTNDYTLFKTTLDNFIYLKIASVQDKINAINSCGATTTNVLTLKTMKILSIKIDDAIKLLDSYLETIDNNCKSRYNWNKIKMGIQGDISNTDYNGFEKFIGEKVD